MLLAAAALAIGITIPAMAVVTGSPSGFESSDGNMTVEGTNAADWNCFANGGTGFATGINTGAGTCSKTLVPGNAVAIHPDASNGAAGEVTWKAGQKLDASCPTLLNNSTVPNKDDFTGVASYNELDSANPPNTFLYGAEIRAVANGSSSGNVELNQSSGTAACPISRTAGDRLLAFDFTGGGAVLNFHALTWITPDNPNIGGNNGTCNIGNHTPPCWGANVITSGSGSGITVGGCGTTGNDVEGCSNQSAILAGDNGIDKTPLVPQQFAEFGVNLTKVLGLTGCEAFPQEVWESRTSGSSFTSNPEDIEIEQHTIANCGKVKIIKHTQPRGANQNFSYTSNLSGSQLSCTQSTPTNFTLNDNNNTTGDSPANTQDCTFVPVGKYTVTEGGDPNGFTFTGLSCTATGSGSGTQDAPGSRQADITIATGGDTVTCTYVNQQNTATLATQVSEAGPVFPSHAVHDTATIVGNQAADTPSGPVTFSLCGPIPGGSGSCGSGGTKLTPDGTLSGSGGTATATSPDVNTSANPLTPGFYCFRAEWPGDNHYPTALSEFGGANGTNECFTVQQIATTTTTTPQPAGTATFGSSVTDHAIVQAVTSGDGTPTGTVTFFLCNPGQVSGGNCATGGNPVGNAVPTAAVANSSPPASSADSDAVTVSQLGTWCWRAVYTPGGTNGSNYTGSSDASSGECFTVTDTTSAASQQTWVPNDSATVTAAHGAPLNGTLSIQLFSDGTCGTTGGSPVGQPFTKTLTNATSAADRTLTTNNTTPISTSTSVSWQVTFTPSSGANVGPPSSTCESSNLTITN